MFPIINFYLHIDKINNRITLRMNGMIVKISFLLNIHEKKIVTNNANVNFSIIFYYIAFHILLIKEFFNF